MSKESPMPDRFTRFNTSHHRVTSAMTIGALGIVFGDIGTSPLYSLRECFVSIQPTHENVLGILSLIFWSLTLVVSLKYAALVMKADNRGEGGVLALMALSNPTDKPSWGRKHGAIILLGVFGASLLYGDGMLTPAVSVLSAIEGLQIATPFFDPFIIPLTIGVLIALFFIQKRGTAKIGSYFGPIMVIWFVSIGLLGLNELIKVPSVIAALNPLHAIKFFATNSWHAFIALGAVFLSLTGAEALYADMGHFGRGPIRRAWFSIALPGLLLNYFGQGALLLNEPGAVENPFYRLAPQWALYPMVVLSTIATIIASQAIISGTFSLTSQAMKLGLLPRMSIYHTSKEEIGQIYVSQINWALLIATLWLVLEFRTSSNLAAAYGIAVATTMVLTTILIFFVMRNVWKWSTPLSVTILVFFLSIDLAFFGSNLHKIHDGGWFPLLIGGSVSLLMTTWRRGRHLLLQRLKETAQPLELFVHYAPETAPICVPGTAIYMSADKEITPPALVNNLKHNKVVHELTLVVVVLVEEVPYVSPVRRVEVEHMGKRIYRVTLHYGFMDIQDVPRALGLCKTAGLDFDVSKATFFMGRETLLPAPRPAMMPWRYEIFAFMSRNALRAQHFFRIKASQVIELGYEVEI